LLAYSWPTPGVRLVYKSDALQVTHPPIPLSRRMVLADPSALGHRPIAGVDIDLEAAEIDQVRRPVLWMEAAVAELGRRQEGGNQGGSAHSGVDVGDVSVPSVRVRCPSEEESVTEEEIVFGRRRAAIAGQAPDRRSKPSLGRAGNGSAEPGGRGASQGFEDSLSPVRHELAQYRKSSVGRASGLTGPRRDKFSSVTDDAGASER